MLTKSQLEKYADVMVWAVMEERRGKFSTGDIVRVKFELPAMSLAEEIQIRLLDKGMHASMRPLISDNMERNFYEHASDKQLSFVMPWEETAANSINGNIFILAPTSLTHLKDIDPAKMAKKSVAMKPLRDILNDREYAGQFGWTVCTFPTEASSEKANMTVKQYANQIAKACYLNESDPVGAWKTAMKDMGKIRVWLNRMLIKTNSLHVQSKNMDLTIVPGNHRRWMGGEGANIPSFELFLSPDYRHTEGVYFANLPSYRQGNYVEEVRMVFKKGSAVEITAKKGEEYVQKTAKMDKGASRVGEFSLTDKRFSKINKFMAEILYDENFGGRYGNCHLALGSSYGETYNGDLKTFDKEKKTELGFNDSALHWDLINTEDKIVTALFNNGREKVIYEKGMFTY